MDKINEAAFGYATALRAPGACTAEEASKLGAYYGERADSETPAPVDEWRKEVSPQCAECVFSDGSGATWTPLIVENNALAFVNRGGCIEIVSGNESCGRAYQHVTTCRAQACDKCQTSEDYFDCIRDAVSLYFAAGPCESAYEALVEACGNQLGSFEAACDNGEWTFEAPIRVQCIGIGDGGI
jgi:hypothetical protein